MEPFTEEHSKRLLGKEWLAKADANLSCIIMVTDTKKVWAEVVTSNLLARRWRACNTKLSEQFADSSDEERWRETTLELLSRAHTIGGVTDSSFQVAESNYSDLCLELEWETFKWKWETCFLGYGRSSEIISQHLILPLISVNQLTFSATEVIGTMSDADVEKSLDKLGRTARRAADTHIKNALSRPRLTTCLSRMTALFNFVPDLPRVLAVSEKPSLQIEEVKADIPNPPDVKGKGKLHRASPELPVDMPTEKEKMDEAVDSDSVTESDSDEPASKAGPRPVPVATSISEDYNPATSVQPAQSLAATTPVESKVSSDSESPKRPAKKIKTVIPDSSDDDTGHEHIRPGVGGPKRGTRQPIKRGGKRF